MSTATMPSTGLTLHGIARADEVLKPSLTPAIAFKLGDNVLDEVRKASGVQGGLQFVTGNFPKIRLGKKTIDLTISPESFRHELYSASTESLRDYDFAAVVSHRAELHILGRKQSIGTDAAVAALQSKLASFEREKEAKSVNISSTVVAEPKNRWEAAREQKQARRRGLVGQYPASPSVGASATPRASTDLASFATDNSAARMRAMKTPLVHLLAMRPLSYEDILEKTRIPKEELDDTLGRIGKQEQGKWQLVDRAYKELDVWNFAYSSQEARQAAIENAIRAYDRLRLGKDESLWQKLLPDEDRDKGMILSKLHLAPVVNGNATGSPLVPGDGVDDSNTVSTSNTPRLGPSVTTPKLAAGKGGGGALSKRLFANNPKKRAAEETKERKRKEKEAAAAAASDREVGRQPPPRKKQTTKPNNTKYKSTELVHSSSEESEGEIKEVSTSTAAGQSKPVANSRKPTTNPSRPRPKPVDSVSPINGNAPTKSARPKTVGASTPKIGTGVTTPSAPRSNPSSSTKSAKPSTLAKSTANGLSAPTSNRDVLSPQKSASRPKVPSPLGPARPRVASDVSEKGSANVPRARHGAEVLKGLGITNGVRKRQDTVSSAGSYTAARTERTNGEAATSTAEKSHRPAVNGATSRTSLSNGNAQKDAQGVKRKAVDSPNPGMENGHAVKHRKTTSTSSHSQKSSISANSSVDNRLERSTSSDSSSSIINDITYSQGVNIAQKFRDVYYPKYAQLYDEQAAMERRGETVSREERDKLWTMHRRLEQMKREIRAASQREHVDE